jgi:uncharacterized protein YqiB (DUF1249 family)
MTELDVLRLLLARRENYSISDIQHISGRTYSLTMNRATHIAIIVTNSFDFYQLRYHIAKHVPTLVICFQHDTVVPVTCLSLKASRIAMPYDLPAKITNVEAQRHRSKIGSQCLLGMYLCGMRAAQDIIHHKDFPKTTRKRYLQRAKDLGKRRRGRPVDTQQAKTKAS